MNRRLDMTKIATTLGAERMGRVTASAGYFGALDLAAEVQHRFRAPAHGGRPTDPTWTERRLVGLSPATLKRLHLIASTISRDNDLHLNAMQVAALLIERALRDLSDPGQLLGVCPAGRRKKVAA